MVPTQTLAVFAQAGIGLIFTLNVVVGVRFCQFAFKTASEEFKAHRARKARGLEMPGKLSREERKLWEVFATTDMDGSGSIGKEELEKILHDGHYDFTQTELDDMLNEVDKDHSGQLEWGEFKQIAKKLSLMSVPEAGGLGRLLYFEQIMWFFAQCLTPIYMYTSVGPVSLWEQSPDFLSYLAELYLNGIEYAAFRRMLYVCATIVYLVAGFPFLLFKVPVIGPAVFGLRKLTGYDQQGNVRALMTGEELHTKYDLEKQRPDTRAKDSTLSGHGKGLTRQLTGLAHAPFNVSKAHLPHLPKFGKRHSAHASEEEKAATSIQSRIRGRDARRAAAAKTDAAAGDDKEAVEKSAATIQSRIRGRQARRAAAAAKKTGAGEEATSSQSATSEASQSKAVPSEATAKTPRSSRGYLSRVRSMKSKK